MSALITALTVTKLCTVSSGLWALLCTPHWLIVKSFNGSDAASLSLSVVITTAAHYQCRNTIFSFSTLSLTCTRSNTELTRSHFDSNGSSLKCFPRRQHGDREIVAVVVIRRPRQKGHSKENCPITAANFPLQVSQQQTN